MSRLVALCGALALSLATVAASARPVFEPVSRERAEAALGACDESELGSVEAWGTGFRAVCSGVETGRGKWVNVAAYEQAERCEAKADLDYRLAELVGVNADAAWEDSYAACVGAP